MREMHSPAGRPVAACCNRYSTRLQHAATGPTIGLCIPLSIRRMCSFRKDLMLIIYENAYPSTPPNLMFWSSFTNDSSSFSQQIKSESRLDQRQPDQKEIKSRNFFGTSFL